MARGFSPPEFDELQKELEGAMIGTGSGINQRGQIHQATELRPVDWAAATYSQGES